MHYGKFLLANGFKKQQKISFHEDPDDGNNQIGNRYLVRKSTTTCYQKETPYEILQVEHLYEKYYEITVIKYGYVLTRTIECDYKLVVDYVENLLEMFERMF